MPVLTLEELKAEVLKGSIGGLSLDTSVIRSFGYKFKSPPLINLYQFSHSSDVSVIFPEIIILEVKKHLNEQTDDYRKSLKKKIHAYHDKWYPDFDVGDVYKTLDLDGNCLQLADKRVDGYINFIQAEIAGINDVALSQITDMYFNAVAPFENKGAKKHEFPDAIALSCLEKWAEKKGKFVIAISKDHGWREFAEKSSWLIYADDITLVLDQMNHARRIVAEESMKVIDRAIGGAITGYDVRVNLIDDTIEEYLAEADYDVDAQVDNNENYFHEQYIGWTRLEKTKINTDDVRVLSVDTDKVEFLVTCICDIESTAIFGLEVYDQEDVNYGTHQSPEISHQSKVDIPIVITMSRGNKPTILKVEVLNTVVRVDFGYIQDYFF